MVSFTDKALEQLGGLTTDIPSVCLRISPVGAVRTGVFLKGTMDEQQAGDTLCESNGLRIALNKGLDPNKSAITIDHTDAEFVAILE